MLYGGFYMKDYVLNYVKENFKIIKILTACILIGIFVGIIVYQASSVEIKNEFVTSIKETLDISKTEQYEGINVLKNGILLNLLVVLSIYAASITLIAPICVCALNFIKGVSIGIYISTLFSVFGFGKGIMCLILVVILPNLIYIPAYIYMGCNSINLHYKLVENDNKFSIVLKEVYKLIIAISLIVLSIVIEQFASFGAIGMYIT